MTRSTPQKSYDLCHERGLNFSEIAEELGISIRQARRYVKKREEKAWLEAQWHYGLPLPVANALMAADFHSREQLLTACHNNDLTPKGPHSPHRIGKMGIQAIEEWLEIPLESRSHEQKFRQIDVKLDPDAQRALKRLEHNTGELPSAIITRLILEADKSD